MRSQLTGDWDKVGMVLRKLSTSIVPIAKVKLDEYGKLVLDKLISHIDSQDLDWQSLSPITVQRKGSSMIYVETGDLKNSFEITPMTKVQGYQLFIGVNPNAIHSESGLPMNDLMLYLEYGTATIPPRPLIRPTWEEVEPVIKEDCRNLILDLIKG